MRTRGLVAVWVAGCLALSACSSETDDGALELPDDGAAAPEGTEPAVAPSDDPTEPEAEEPLYPPLPDLEPDPSSDVPIDQQEAAFRLHGELYEATQEALHTGEADHERLARLLDESLLESFMSSLDSRAPGEVSRSPDTEVRWVRVVEAGSGPIVIQECRVIGPETGVFGADNERVSPEREAPEARIFQTTYLLVESGGDDLDYRAVEAGSDVDPSLCDV